MVPYKKKRIHASQSLNMQFLASKTLFTLEKTDRFHTSSVHAIRFQMVPEVIKIMEEGVLREWSFSILGTRAEDNFT